eukprot:640443-Rhodomonas_salina.1
MRMRMQAKEEAERAQKERLERLETQFEARREKLKAQVHHPLQRTSPIQPNPDAILARHT